MTNLFHIATIDIGNIIPVIIVFGVIISKIIKTAVGAKKNLTNQNSSSNEEKPAYRAAPDELRSFLETLTGIPQETKEAPIVAAPPLPPRQASRPQQTKQPKAKHVKRTPQQTAAKVKTATPVIPVKKEYHPRTKSADFKWHDGNLKNKHLVSPAEIANDLISRKSLAKAIMLKEILSPPVALK